MHLVEVEGPTDQELAEAGMVDHSRSTTPEPVSPETKPEEKPAEAPSQSDAQPAEQGAEGADQPKEEPKPEESKPAPQEKKYWSELLQKEVTADELYDLHKKTEGKVTQLTQELSDKSGGKPESKDDKPVESKPDDKPAETEPKPVEQSEIEKEVDRAVELLREKGQFVTKDDVEKIRADIKAEFEADQQKKADEEATKVANAKAADALKAIDALSDEYKDTALAFKADDLAEYMIKNMIPDPTVAFKLMHGDKYFEFEKAKRGGTKTEPPFTETRSKDAFPSQETAGGVEEFSLNNPNIDSVLTSELESKTI